MESSGLVSLPASLIIRSKPEDMGLLPDGARVSRPATMASSSSQSEQFPDHVSEDQSSEFTVRQALRTRAFWLILLGVVTRDFKSDFP